MVENKMRGGKKKKMNTNQSGDSFVLLWIHRQKNTIVENSGWPGLTLPWPGLMWPGSTWPDVPWPGPAWTGLAWVGLTWLDWPGLACPCLA